MEPDCSTEAKLSRLGADSSALTATDGSDDWTSVSHSATGPSVTRSNGHRTVRKTTVHSLAAWETDRFPC